MFGFVAAGAAFCFELLLLLILLFVLLLASGVILPPNNDDLFDIRGLFVPFNNGELPIAGKEAQRKWYMADKDEANGVIQEVFASVYLFDGLLLLSVTVCEGTLLGG